MILYYEDYLERKSLFSIPSLPLTIQTDCVVDIYGVQLPCRSKPKESLFITTNRTKEILKNMALHLSLKWPILLEGPCGSGKTALVDELAKRTGQGTFDFLL